MHNKINKKSIRNKKAVNPFDVILVLTLTSTIIFSSMFLIYRKSSPSMINDLVNSMYSYRESVNKDLLKNYQEFLVEEMLPWEVVLSIYEREGEEKKYSENLQTKISSSFYDDVLGYFFVMNPIDETFLMDKVRILLQDKIAYIHNIKYDFYNDKIKIFSYITKENALKAFAQAYRIELSKSKESLLQIAKNEWSDNCLYLFLNYSENKLTLPNAMISEEVLPFFLTYLASDIKCTPFCKSGFYNFEISGSSCGSNKLFNRDGIEEEVSEDMKNIITKTIENLKQVLTLVDKLPFDAENKLKLVAYIIKYHPNKKIVSSLSTLDLKDPKSLEDAILTICNKDLIQKDFCYSRLNKLEKDYNSFKYEFGITKNYVFEKSEISTIKDERLLEWTYLSKPFPIKEVSKLYSNFTDLFKKYDLGVMILPDKRNIINIKEYINKYYKEKNDTLNNVFFNSLWEFNFSIPKQKSNELIVFEELVGVSFLYSLYLNSLGLKDCDINYDFFDLKKNVGTDKYKYDNLNFNLETFKDGEKTIVDNITLEIRLTDGTTQSYTVSFSQIRKLNNVSITKDTSVDKLNLCTELAFYFVVPFTAYGELIPKKLEYSVSEKDPEKKWRLSNYEYNFLLIIGREYISQHILKDIKEVTINKCVKFQTYQNDAILINFSESDENCQNLKNEILNNLSNWELSCINGVKNDFLSESTYIPLNEDDSRERKFKNLRSKATSYILSDILISNLDGYFFFAEMVNCSDDNYPIFDNSPTSRTVTKEQLANMKLKNLNKNSDGYTFIVNDINQKKFAFIEYYNHTDDELPEVSKIEKDSDGKYNLYDLPSLDLSSRKGVCWFSKAETNYYEINELKVFVNDLNTKYSYSSFAANYHTISKDNSPRKVNHDKDQIKLTFDINFSFNFTAASFERYNLYSSDRSIFTMKDIWNITISAFPDLLSSFAAKLSTQPDFFKCNLKNIKLDLDHYYLIYIAEGILSCELILEDDTHNLRDYDKEISNLLKNNGFIVYIENISDEKNMKRVECLSSVLRSSSTLEECGINELRVNKNYIEKGERVDLSYSLKANRECYYYLKCSKGNIIPLKLAEKFDKDFSNTEVVSFDDIGAYECELSVEKDGSKVESRIVKIEVLEKCQPSIKNFEITPSVAKKRENLDFIFEVDLCSNNAVNLYCINKDSNTKISFVSNSKELTYKQKNYFSEIGNYECNLEILRESVVEISESKEIKIDDLSSSVQVSSPTPISSCSAKINSFISSKNILESSESVELSWDATICSDENIILECNDENGIQELNLGVTSIGKITFTPSKEGKYTCKLSILKSSRNVVSKSLSLEVICERKINDFFASPAEVCKDGDISLSWNVKICKNDKVNLFCSVDKTSHDVTSLVSGRKMYKIEDISSHSCTLSVLDNSGNVLVSTSTDFESVSCVVPTATASCTPQINEFKSSKNKIEINSEISNEKFTLSWNANLCGNEELNLVCNPGSVNLRNLVSISTYEVNANLDDTYRCELRLINKTSGDIIDKREVEVDVIDKRISFTLNTNQIEYLGTVKATWSAPAKAKSVKLILDYDSSSLTDLQESLSNSGSKNYKLNDFVKFIYLVEFRDGSSKNIEFPVCVLPKVSLSINSIECKKYKVDLVLEHNDNFLRNKIQKVSISDKLIGRGTYSSNKLSYSTELENKVPDTNDKVIIEFNDLVCNNQEVTYKYPKLDVPSFTFSGTVQNKEFLFNNCNNDKFIQNYIITIVGPDFLKYFDKFSLSSITSGNVFIKDFFFNQLKFKSTYVSEDLEINYNKNNKLEIIRKNIKAPCGVTEAIAKHVLTLTDCNGKNYEVYFEFTFKDEKTTFFAKTQIPSSKSCKIGSFTVDPSKLDLAKSSKEFTLKYEVSDASETKMFFKSPDGTLKEDNNLLVSKKFKPSVVGKYTFNLTCKGTDNVVNSKIVEAEVVQSCEIDKFTLSSDKISVGQTITINANFRNSQLKKLLIDKIHPTAVNIIDLPISNENYVYSWTNIKEAGKYNITVLCNSTSSNEIVKQSKIVEVLSPCDSTFFSVKDTSLFIGQSTQINYNVLSGAKLKISIVNPSNNVEKSQEFTSSGSFAHTFNTNGIYKVIGECFEEKGSKSKKEILITVKPSTTKDECKPVVDFKIDSQKKNTNPIETNFIINPQLEFGKFSYDFEISFSGSVSKSGVKYSDPKKLDLKFSLNTKSGSKEFVFSVPDTSKPAEAFYLISNYGEVKKDIKLIDEIIRNSAKEFLKANYGFSNEDNDDFYLMSFLFNYDPNTKTIKVKVAYHFKVFLYFERLKRLKNSQGVVFYLIPSGFTLNFDNKLVFNVEEDCGGSLKRNVKIEVVFDDKIFSQIFNKIADAGKKLEKLLEKEKVYFTTIDRSSIGKPDFIFKYDGFYDEVFKKQKLFPYLSIIKYYSFFYTSGKAYILICLSNNEELYCTNPIFYGKLEHVLDKKSQSLVYIQNFDSSSAKLFSDTFGYSYFQQVYTQNEPFSFIPQILFIEARTNIIDDLILTFSFLEGGAVKNQYRSKMSYSEFKHNFLKGIEKENSYSEKHYNLNNIAKIITFKSRDSVIGDPKSYDIMQYYEEYLLPLNAINNFDFIFSNYVFSASINPGIFGERRGILILYRPAGSREYKVKKFLDSQSNNEKELVKIVTIE